MYNINNNGTCIGILAPNKKGGTEAVTRFNPNSDGSMRVALTVMAGDNFKSRWTDAELAAMSPEVKAKRVDANGKGYKSQRIGLTAYLPVDAQSKAPRGLATYNRLKPGDLVAVSYTVKSGSYVDKDGVTQYTQSLEIDTIRVLKHASEAPVGAGDVEGTPVDNGDEDAF